VSLLKKDFVVASSALYTDAHLSGWAAPTSRSPIWSRICLTLKNAGALPNEILYQILHGWRADAHHDASAGPGHQRTLADTAAEPGSWLFITVVMTAHRNSALTQIARQCQQTQTAMDLAGNATRGGASEKFEATPLLADGVMYHTVARA